MVKAHPVDIDRFVRHHLTLGAREIFLFLDDPGQVIAGDWQDDPRLRITRTDDVYWAAQAGARPDSARMRQSVNATRAYRETRADWLAHIDIDEFLLPRGGVSLAKRLAAVAPETPSVHVMPAEYLGAVSGAENLPVFRRPVTRAMQERGLHLDLFPSCGASVPSGFVSHLKGKAITRTGRPGVRIGVHTALGPGGGELDFRPLRHVLLGHCHVRSEAEFVAHTPQRLRGGFYRATGDERRTRIAALLQGVLDKEGEAGLARVYRELFNTDAAHLQRLEAEGLIFRARAFPDLRDARDGAPWVPPPLPLRLWRAFRRRMTKGSRP